ncbi:MAG: YfhO family protein [Hyphomicrobiaceae bacterium]
MLDALQSREGRPVGLAGTISIVASRRRVTLAMTLITLIWLVACARWWWADAVVPWDSKNQFYAFFRFLADELQAGRLPFWNPYHYGGHPAIADPQSMVFQPQFVLWGLIEASPSLRGFDRLVMAHLLVGGLATAGLGHRRGWPPAASILAAVVFMLGGAASARLNHVGIITVYGLFPLALLCLEIALERRSHLYGVAFGIVAAMIVLGRNQVSLMLAMVLAALALAEVLRAPSPVSYVRQRIGVIAVMGIVIMALVAVPLLLTLQLAAHSNRPEVSLATALEASLYPADLASMAVANMFGQLSGDYLYWGPNAQTLPDVAATDDSFNYLFLGAAPVILVLWLGIASQRRAGRERKIWGAIALVALLFSLGRYTPLFGLVFEHVPGFAFFRRPIDGVFILGLAMAMLAGVLLAEYVREGVPPLDPMRLACALSIVVAVLAGALAFSGRTGHGVAGAWEIARAVPVIAFIVIALLSARTLRARTTVAAVVAAVTAAELIVWNAASRLNAEDRDYYEVLKQAHAEDQDALRVLSDDMARRDRGDRRPRVEFAGIDGPWQNLAIVRKLEATNGYNPLRIGIYDHFVKPGEVGAFLDEREFSKTFPAYDCPLARALGLEYLVLARPIEDYATIKQRPIAETLKAGPKVWIYRLRPAFPRIRFTSRFITADVEALRPDGSLMYPPSADRAVIDIHTPPAGKPLGVGSAHTGTARITSWAADKVEIEVKAQSSGVLVLADTYYPGWVAELDGARVPILRADVLFRAVEVPAGQHKVVFSYRPLSAENLLDAIARLGNRDKNAGGPLTP